MNLLFPFSVTVLDPGRAAAGTRALAVADDPFRQRGFALLATLMVLAILEHWLLVLPSAGRGCGMRCGNGCLRRAQRAREAGAERHRWRCQGK